MKTIASKPRKVKRATAATSACSLKLSKRELAKARQSAALEKTEGAALDAATLQRLRIRLWRIVEGEFDASAAKDLLSLIVAARRASALEERERRKADEQARERQLTIAEQEDAVRRMYGPLPWIEESETEKLSDQAASEAGPQPN
jgi:hypothetical protein